MGGWMTRNASRKMDARQARHFESHSVMLGDPSLQLNAPSSFVGLVPLPLLPDIVRVSGSGASGIYGHVRLFLLHRIHYLVPFLSDISLLAKESRISKSFRDCDKHQKSCTLGAYSESNQQTYL